MSARTARWRGLALATLVLLTGGCGDDGRPPIPPVAEVDLPRFMGDWYVIAHIPSPVETGVHNAVESYSLLPDGRVQTVFRYRDGSFDAPAETMRPVGTVRPGTHNAVWGMQFVWPIKAEYIIASLDPRYRQTVIARNARDYAWIMARTPQIPDADLARHIEHLRALGYDVSRLRRVPQRWPER